VLEYKEPERIMLDMPEVAGDQFRAAMRLAEAGAETRLGWAMLLSWKDNATGACSPVVESCTCGLEGWELYALSRGVELRVEVGGRYVFMFKQV